MHYLFYWDSKYNRARIQSIGVPLIREHFSIDNKAAHVSSYFSKKYIPKRIHIITPEGRFDPGIFNEIYEYIKSTNNNYSIEIKNDFKNIINPKLNIDYNNISKLNYELRDYQELAVKEAIKKGRGSIILPTASGKTLVMCSIFKTIYDNLKKKTVIIVPSLQLIEQTYDDFINYGINKSLITKWSGENNPNLSLPLIIVGYQILLSENTNLSILSDIDVLMVDEMHKLSYGNKINKIIRKIVTPHKFGFTGTLPENKINKWNCVGLIGPVIIKKTIKELQSNNYISNAFILILKLNYADKFIYKEKDGIKRYNEEWEYLYTNKFRNKTIVKLCNNVNKNVLILVDRINHGEIIFNLIKIELKNKEVYFIKGEIDVEERERIRKLMEQKNNIVCIAMSSIFSTGININNLHYIIFGSSNKSKIRTIQSIGRGLRLHECKNKMILIDISDNLYYTNKHLLERLRFYKNEGFKYETKESTEVKNTEEKQ